VAGLAACMPFPLMTLALAAEAPLPAVMALALLAGGGVALFAVCWNTVLGALIPPDLLSRVSAFDWLGSVALVPLGYLGAGLLATAVGPEEVLFGGSMLALCFLVAALVPTETRELRPVIAKGILSA
jgi:hypothetical protein